MISSLLASGYFYVLLLGLLYFPLVQSQFMIGHLHLSIKPAKRCNSWNVLVRFICDYGGGGNRIWQKKNGNLFLILDFTLGKKTSCMQIVNK